MAQISQIAEITEVTKEAIRRKSAEYLPDRPTDMGMKPSDIKKAFYRAITESSDSAIAEIDRVISEINNSIETPTKEHIENKGNPHGVSKAQVGLSQCDNTADLAKQVSAPQKLAFDKIRIDFEASLLEIKNKHDDEIANIYKTLGDDYRKIDDSLSMSETISEKKYNEEQGAQDTKTQEIQNGVGNVTELSHIASSVVDAILSLNEDIDNIQLGVEPRSMRGVIQNSEPDKLNAELIAAMDAEVKKTTGRDQPNNSDSIQVWDNAMPDAGRVYTYNFWFTPGSSINGWYLGSVYTSPAITEIPSYVYNILETSWTPTADSNGLYYLTVPPEMHGMGSDMTLYVDLRRQVSETDYELISLFKITANGTVVCYTDEKFHGKLIIRVGKAYYTTHTTNVVTVEMEQVNGLGVALGEKLDKTGDAGDTKVTFGDIAGTAENITSGSTLKSTFGKIKNWFSRLGALAFKNNITKGEIGLSNVVNERQYSASNPPPYPVVANGTYPLMSVGNSKIAQYASTDESKGTIDWRLSHVKTNSGAFDKVIRTQTEFEELISSATWLGAKSIMFVGDGGTLQFSATVAVTIPPTVKNIEGINSAIIKITGSSPYEMYFGYEFFPQSDDYSIVNLKVVSECNFGGVAFLRCMNLINCIAETSFPPTLQVANGTSGFISCKNLLNCSSNIYSNNSNKQGEFICSAFYDCTDLSNCKGEVTADDSHGCIVFSYCENLSNCRGRAISATGTGYAFYHITNATNCRQLYSSDSSTAMWGGTNKNVDIETCRKTQVIANNDTLNT